MATDSPALVNLLNQLPASSFADMMAENPNLKNWVNKNNYMHPSVMQSNRANAFLQTNEQFLRNPTDVNVTGNMQGSNMPVFMQQQMNNPVTQNLGMSSPRPGIPHPLAPSARVSAGGQLISPTPTNREMMPPTYPFVSKYYDSASSPSSFMSGQGVNAKSALPASSRAVGTSGSFMSGAGEVFGSEASEQAVAESIAKSGTESAGASGLTGPQAFFANMALEAIPTRDRNKVNTPFGDQGSVPGILKGAGKGALIGSTIDTATGGATGGLGTIGGAIIGGISGAQGTFDSSTPRQVIGMSTRRPSGGLLQVPKGLYG